MTYISDNPPSTELFFFFNDTATTEIYTLSLHDALPISPPLEDLPGAARGTPPTRPSPRARRRRGSTRADRKSTRLNSSHLVISYAVFCLKKKKARRPARHWSALVSCL